MFDKELSTLRKRLKTLHEIRGALALLTWDQETYMPPGSAESRARQLATLERISHETFTSAEMGDLLDTLKPLETEDSLRGRLVQVTRREFEKERRIPPSLVTELSEASSHSLQAWKAALEKSDYQTYLPHLKRVLDLTIQKAEALTYETCRYDALLDIYEPETPSSHLDLTFSRLKERVVDLVARIADAPQPDGEFLKKDYNGKDQETFYLKVITAFGFDFSRGRLDFSVHPLTIAPAIDDVRLTTHIHEDYLPSALFGAFHECGHGLYYQGTDHELDGTPLEDGASLGMHESQSRLWENLIGRSRPFWQHYYPPLQSLFPDQLGKTSLNDFYRAINRVQPSLIRVQADEVTYNLHIILRYEMEKALVEEEISPADLPDLWREKMKAYLGVEPKNDAEGVLQDIHWSQGAFGYFPTYTLGNIMSAQIFGRMKEEIPDIQEQIALGKFEAILAWLRENIHRHGRRYPALELIERATGKPLDCSDYLAYLDDKYGEIYSL